MSGSSLKYGSRRDLTVDCLKGIAALIVFLLHGRSYVPTIDQISGCLAWISYFPAWGGGYGYSLSCLDMGLVWDFLQGSIVYKTVADMKN